MTPAPADDTAPVGDLDYIEWYFKRFKARLPDKAAQDQFINTHLIVVYMEAPTNRGSKFWEARILSDRVQISHGPGGSTFHVPEADCGKKGLIGEFFYRARAKLKQRKGYAFIANKCSWPLP